MQGRDFLSGLSAVNLDQFSDICLQGQPGSLELLDVTGANSALSLPSPTKTASETALTPHYEDEALFKKAKVESDHDDAIHNMASSSTAGLVHVKTESTARLPLPPAPPATGTTL